MIRAHEILPRDALSLSEDLVPAALQIVQIYVQFKESAGLTLTTDEYRALGRLLTSRLTLSTSGNAFIVLGLCCYTALPDLLMDRSAEAEFVEWVRWQLEVDVALLDEQAPMGGTHLEVLLLLASHIRAGQYKEISEIISEYLDVKVRRK